MDKPFASGNLAAAWIDIVVVHKAQDSANAAVAERHVGSSRCNAALQLPLRQHGCFWAVCRRIWLWSSLVGREQVALGIWICRIWGLREEK